MSHASDDNGLARAAGCDPGGEDTVWSVLPPSSQDEKPSPAAARPGTKPNVPLDELVERIRALSKSGAAGSTAEVKAADAAPPNTFVPVEPSSFRTAGLNDALVESLVLKFYMARGTSTGREAAEQVKLPFLLIDELLRSLKNDRLLTHRGDSPMNDFVYELTDMGRDRARRFWNHCTYFGAAPVSLDDYVTSVKAQSLTDQHPTPERLREAFCDMVLSERMLDRLGPAINSGRGLFLFGSPGNGKTSIAQRVTRAFGQVVWVPRAIGIDGEIVRVYDPAVHEELPLEACDGLYDRRRIDKRWVRIRRPTIVVGGELTLASLEVAQNLSTGICEAPLQLKSNCGTLVIDDFGRQRIRADELLNRWIVPLENRYDFLNLPNGKKIQVPFDQLVIFATNLEPKDLVDEAFLRRIPYKIDVHDPTEDEVRRLFQTLAPKLGFEYRPEPIEDLLERHYRQKQRPLRCCHPRDLLMQIRSYCMYKNRPMEITAEYFDMAVENYFAIM